MSELSVNEIRTLDGQLVFSKNANGVVLASSVATIADLATASKGTAIQVLGFHTKGDGGGGVFFYDADASKTLHNGGTVIDPDKVSLVTNWDANQTAYFTAATTGVGVWKREYTGAVNVKWFGATNSSGLMAAVTYINSIGGGTLELEQGINYIVDWATSAENLLVFSNCENVRIVGNGATITCINSGGNHKVLFQIVNCDGFEIENLNIIGSLGSLSSTLGGEIAINIMSGTKNVIIRNILASGCYRFFGSNLMSGANDVLTRDTSPCSRILIENINLLNTYYGFYFGSSGNGVIIRNVIAKNTGRVYYNVNASNHDVWIDSSHGGKFSDCLISCQPDNTYTSSANTIENINLTYTTAGRYSESGDQNPYEALVAFDFTITGVIAAPGAIRNVKINLNAQVDATNKTSNLVTFRKYYNNGSSMVVDNIGGRGHTLKGIVISGQARGCENLSQNGLVLCANQSSMNWVGDIINGLVVRDFNLTGSPSVTNLGIYLNGTGGSINTQTFTLNNVVSDGLITYVGGATSNLSVSGVNGRIGGDVIHATDINISNVVLTLTGSTAAPTTAVTNNAFFTKRGSVVTVYAYFSNFSTEGATGDLIITGLPYVPIATAVGSVASSNIAIPGSGIVAMVYAGSSTINFVSPQNSLALLTVPVTPTGTGRYLFFTLTYITN
jgi:hypothetical protein